MKDKSPLAGLKAVRWSRLEHAYGSASDVPGLLKELRSADPAQREKALNTLYGNIFHQGSRFEATAYAVPFLLALAADPSTPSRPGIVRLLGALAIGYDESCLPAGVDIGAWRGEVAGMRAADPDRAYAMGELAAYDAVRAGVPALCALLGDPDPALRAVAAWTLAWFPEESAQVLPRLLGLLDTETIPGVAANAIVAAGLLGDATLTDRLQAFLTAGEPLPRWAAATALARLGESDSAVTRELAACGANPPEQGEPGIVFHEGDLRGYASASLALLDGEVPDEAVTALLDGLSRTSGTDAFAPATAALRLVFGPEGPATRVPYDALTEPQRRTVRVLAELDEETWRWLNFTEIVRAWNLPEEREECRRYAGLP